MPPSRILVVRLGAMGDVIHALPAVATLQRNFPGARIAWAIHPKWAGLLGGNPYVDEILPVDVQQPGNFRRYWLALRRPQFDMAVDLQGLIKSALMVRASGARRRIGFDRSQAREPLASVFYTHPVAAASLHAVDRGLELVKSTGATRMCREFPLPLGRPEGDLPPSPFILASPLAGWVSKQWPLEYYSETAARLSQDGYTLVINGPPGAIGALARVRGAHVHVSGIEGLLDATRRAAGVIGVDSGPLHLAAALGQPGVAIFGPTDPARNGPYGGAITVLRDASAYTSYQRHGEIAASMLAIRPEAVMAALRLRLALHAGRTRG